MSVAHDSINGAHLGIRRTKDKVLSSFYWPGVDGDVTRYCRSCDVCQRTVKKGTVPRVPLEKVPLIDTPFKRVAIDLVGPINPPSEAGHRFIMTLVDYATRFAEAMPLRKIDTESVAEALVDIYSRLGVPEEVLSDQGTQFLSDCMKKVCRLLGIKQKTTTPYHPMCNGLVESYEYVLNLRERLDDTLKIAREELEKAQGRQKRYYDRTAKRRKFSVGEKMLVLLPTDSNKLLMQWKGPFEIVATVGINDYRINMGGKEKTFHANLLKGYIARDWDTGQATTDERPPTSSSATPAASVTVIEDLEGEHFNDSDCEALPELGGWGSEESVKDLKFGDGLTLDQRHSLGRGAIGLQDENEKVRNAPRPKTKREIRAFLGLVGYYKEFVPNFAAVSAPLSDLVRKGQPNIMNWGDSQERAYNSLKVAVTSKPVLQMPDVNKRFVLRTDASNRGLGAALMQENEGTLFPVAYASKKLTDRERKYSVTEREALAIVWGVKKFSLYLYGTVFTLQADHGALQFLNAAKFDSPRIMRWALALRVYNFDVQYIKGSENVVADYLSRIA
ncbi:Zinc finger protein [Plakobranchus ocellatus]|uniref:Zinc finger protein n=1 Tax=Plakobranchus ocellatus TaxID=259542 RepID=A0AAV4CQY6_9GAST|nr:Zinc finger protein [Plakobranchus ocellatus]